MKRFWNSIAPKLTITTVLAVALLAGMASAGSLTPPGLPGSTMHTLEEIYASIAGLFDSSAIVADQNGSLMQHLKFIEANMGTGSGVSSDSLDYDEFVDNMNLDANTNIASHGFALTTDAKVGIGTTTPAAQLSIQTRQKIERAIEVSSASAFGSYFKIASSGLSTIDGAAIAPKFSTVTKGPVPGTTLQFAREVYVAGKYAYVAVNGAPGSPLVIFDITNPASPSFVGKSDSVSLSGAGGIIVIGNYAYISTFGRDSLAVADVSNPASPSFVAETRGPIPGTSMDGCWQLSISGSYAYLSCFNRNAVVVVDIANPLNPRYVTEIRGPIPGTSLLNVRDIFVSGRYAYAAVAGTHSLAVLDISNPASPSFLAQTQGPVPGTSLNTPFGIYVSGRYAYVANIGGASLAIVDISNPRVPVFISETRGPVPGTSFAGAHSVFVSGRYAYVTNATRDSLAVVDVSNPYNPIFVGETRGPVPGTSLDNISGLFVNGRYLYAALNAGNGLATIDIGGLAVSNMTTGALEVGNLNVESFANFDASLWVRGGLGVGGTALLQSGLSVSNASISSNFAGNVGVGTTTPFTKLHIFSNADTNILRLQDSDGTCDHNPESGGETITCSSDERLKDDIRDAASALSYLNGFRIRDYTVKSSGDRVTGVIAQELVQTHPELVSSVSGFLSVQQPSIWLLVKAIQELQGRVSTPAPTPLSKPELKLPTPTPGTGDLNINVIASDSGVLKLDINVVGSVSEKLIPDININVIASLGAVIPSITVVASQTNVLLPDTGSVFDDLFERILAAFKHLLRIEFRRGIITTHEVRADKLCVGDVCVTEQEFMKLVKPTR